MPIARVPLIQKEIIYMGKAKGKIVITATQMLDSMIRNPRPTRAEVNDVASSVYDGCDAVMLSGGDGCGEISRGGRKDDESGMPQRRGTSHAAGGENGIRVRP